jgi:tagatose-1,6-bisphosphate aldolase
VSDETLVQLKEDVVRTLGPLSSAVLLDPETGVGPCLARGALKGQTGLITALDTGSTGDPDVRRTGLVEGWDVEKAARAGAAGVKLLVYYHPESADATRCEALVEDMGQACARHEMPLFLEPLSCPANDRPGALPSSERPEVVVETARRLAARGVDILKAEFPVDVAEQPDERVWLDACQRLSRACPVPWLLLSAGVSFDTFLRQARIACDAGASGVMVGRAVWKESVTADVAVRNRFLSSVGRDRMDRLRSLCDALGRPLTEIYDPPQVASHWYQSW